MAVRIAKNNTDSDITLTDLGAKIIPASGQIDLAEEFTLEQLSISEDLTEQIGNGNLTINDGSKDLEIADGIDIIRRIISRNPKSEDGKDIVRAESRPLGCTTVFVGQADTDIAIGAGEILAWDFSNEDNEITMPSGSNERRKRLEFKFIDDVYVKEGTTYFFNKLKGSYLDFYVACPAGQYYYDNDGNPHLATEDTIVSHYVIHCMMQGSCPMGDELNTESCSSKIPNNYKFWIDITVPDNDNISNGHINLEMYRERTVIL
jgi:hypothetical protein